MNMAVSRLNQVLFVSETHGDEATRIDFTRKSPMSNWLQELSKRYSRNLIFVLRGMQKGKHQKNNPAEGGVHE
jgi:hypothetical protein